MISVSTCTQRPDFLHVILRNFENQIIKEKELILVLHGFAGRLKDEIENHPEIKIVHISENELLGIWQWR